MSGSDDKHSLSDMPPLQNKKDVIVSIRGNGQNGNTDSYIVSHTKDGRPLSDIENPSNRCALDAKQNNRPQVPQRTVSLPTAPELHKSPAKIKTNASPMKGNVISRPVVHSPQISSIRDEV